MTDTTPTLQAQQVMDAMSDDMEIVTSVYRDGQDGDIPVILLHAFPLDHRMWGRCAQELVRISEENHEDFPVLAPDMPGSGMSPVPDAELSGEQNDDGSYKQACDRLAVSYVLAVQDMGYSKAVWVGISMGGYVALAIQRLFPEMVAGLVLCDTRAERDTAEGYANRLNVARQALLAHSVEPVMHFTRPREDDSDFKKSDEYIATFTDWIDQQSPAGIAWRENMAAGRQDETGTLATIIAPATLISGQLDRFSGPDVMRNMVPLMSGANPAFYEIKDAGHFSCFEKPTEVAQAIEDTVRRVVTLGKGNQPEGNQPEGNQVKEES